MIEFSGKYAMFSNFYDNQILYNNIAYRNNEAAFQAQKTDSEKIRKQFSRMFPSEAVRKGKSLHVRTDWNDELAEKIMYEINKIKFSKEPFKTLLLETKDEVLENRNGHGDVFWGICNGKGENKLGKILMKIRTELQNAGKQPESRKEEE